MDATINRRQHDRVRLNPMYTSVIVDPRDDRMSMLGHAYDVSESGIRIELDEPLDVGQSVRVHLDFPQAGRDIQASADVMWVNDVEDDPGPRRMALKFSKFRSPGDRLCLKAFVRTGARRATAA